MSADRHLRESALAEAVSASSEPALLRRQDDDDRMSVAELEEAIRRFAGGAEEARRLIAQATAHYAEHLISDDIRRASRGKPKPKVRPKARESSFHTEIREAGLVHKSGATFECTILREGAGN